MFTKVAALVLVIVIGVYHMSMGKRGAKIAKSVWFFHWSNFQFSTWIDFKICTGNLQNFDKPFENTETHLGKLSVAFYSGIFSYAGWYVNEMNVTQLARSNKHCFIFPGTIWTLWRKNCVSRIKICHVPFTYRCHWWRPSMFWRIWPIWRFYPNPRCFLQMRSQWYEHYLYFYGTILKFCLAFHALTFWFFLLHADIRKQSTTGLWCLDYSVHGCDISIWWLMRSYYGVVTYVLCWRSKWSYAIYVITH